MTNNIKLVTASGDRPRSLNIVIDYMIRQDFHGEISWVIVDDSETPYPLPDKAGKIPINHIYRGPCPKEEEGLISLSKNLIIALQESQFASGVEMVAVIGDDDWYAQGYLSEMFKRLQGYQAAGHQWVIYGYPPQGIKQLRNDRHAGLEGTVFTPDLIPDMVESCFETMKDVALWPDIQFWVKIAEKNIPANLFRWEFPEEYQMVSLKGKSRGGRYGVGDQKEYNATQTGLGQIIPPKDVDVLLERVYGISGKGYCG